MIRMTITDVTPFSVIVSKPLNCNYGISSRKMPLCLEKNTTASDSLKKFLYNEKFQWLQIHIYVLGPKRLCTLFIAIINT